MIQLKFEYIYLFIFIFLLIYMYKSYKNLNNLNSYINLNHSNSNSYIIYCRVSNTSNMNHHSINRQIDICRKYIKDKEGIELASFIDLGVSSEKSLNERDGFNNLLIYLETNNIPYSDRNILIEDVSRICRKEEMILEFKELIKKYKLNIIPIFLNEFMDILNNDHLLRRLAYSLWAEKEVLIHRINQGKEEKRIQSIQNNQLTFEGKPKISGRKSIIEESEALRKLIQSNPHISSYKLQEMAAGYGIFNQQGKPFSRRAIDRNKRQILLSHKLSYSTYTHQIHHYSTYTHQIHHYSIYSNLTSINKYSIQIHHYSINKYSIQIHHYSTKTRTRLQRIIDQIILLFDEYPLKYCIEDKSWYQFDYQESKWIEIEQESVESHIHDRLIQLEKNDSSFQREIDPSLISNILKMLKLRNEFQIKKWPSNKHIIPFGQLIFNIKTNQIKELTPEYYTRYHIPIDSNDFHKLDIKDFLKTNIYKYLCEVTNNNSYMIYLILSFMYCAICRISHFQTFIELIGPGGTGKSTLANLFIALVGIENVMITDLDNLEKNRFETANLKDKCLLILPDLQPFGPFSGKFKNITGNDPIRNERKGKQTGKPFIYEGIVIITANEEIQIPDTTTGLSRRRITFYFNYGPLPEKRRKLIQINQDGISGEFMNELPLLLKFLLSINYHQMSFFMSDPYSNVPGMIQSKYTRLIHTNGIAHFIYNSLLPNPNGHLFFGTKDNILSIYYKYYHFIKNIRNDIPLSHIRFINQFHEFIQKELHLPFHKYKTHRGQVFIGYSLLVDNDQFELFYQDNEGIIFYLQPAIIEEYHDSISHHDYDIIQINQIQEISIQINQIQEISIQNKPSFFNRTNLIRSNHHPIPCVLNKQYQDFNIILSTLKEYNHSTHYPTCFDNHLRIITKYTKDEVISIDHTKLMQIRDSLIKSNKKESNLNKDK